MPVMFSYNLSGHQNVDNARILSLFQRFGWVSVGGSCFRYPALNAKEHPEDWLNNVVPALMAFRCYLLKVNKTRKVTCSHYSLDAHSSTGYDGEVGRAPAENQELTKPDNEQFGVKNLKTWLKACVNEISYD